MGLPGLLPSAESAGEYRERIRELVGPGLTGDEQVDFEGMAKMQVGPQINSQASFKEQEKKWKMLAEIINWRLERTRPISSWREYPRRNLAQHIARLSG